MNENKIKGLTTELQCQTLLTSLGYNVCIPLGEDCRYDMIADFNGHLTRIQVKTCTVNNTGIDFSVRSVTMNHSQGNVTHLYNKEQIDFFATYYNNQMYMVPVELCGSSTKHLAFERSKFANCQQLLLEDYTAEKQIEKIINNIDVTILEENSKKMKVAQYDLDGNFIQYFDTYIEAARSFGKTSGTHIADVAKGKRKTAYGFVWKLEEN